MNLVQEKRGRRKGKPKDKKGWEREKFWKPTEKSTLLAASKKLGLATLRQNINSEQSSCCTLRHLPPCSPVPSHSLIYNTPVAQRHLAFSCLASHGKSVWYSGPVPKMPARSHLRQEAHRSTPPGAVAGTLLYMPTPCSHSHTFFLSLRPFGMLPTLLKYLLSMLLERLTSKIYFL